MTEPAGFNIPPLEIKISDLGILPDHLEYQNAIKALKGYWSQATVMTKGEQEEYRDLLVTEEAYYVATSAHKPSGHKVYRQLQKQPTWPRWILLLSLYGKIQSLEPTVKKKFGSCKFDDLTSSYKAFFSIDFPETDSCQRDETDRLTKVRRLAKNETTAVERPLKRSEVEGYSNHAAETAARPSSKRPAMSTELTSNKRRLIGAVEVEEQLLEDVAIRLAQRAEEGIAKLEKRVDEMEKKMDQLVGISKEILVALRDNKNSINSLMARKFCEKLEEEESQMVDEADELYVYR